MPWSDKSRAAARERMKALNADPEFKAKTAACARKRMKALQADPEFKAKMKALHADPEFKAKTAARMKALNADPEFKAKTAARMKALHADPEFNRLAGFSAAQRADYDLLMRKGVRAAEAFEAVTRPKDRVCATPRRTAEGRR